MLVGLPAGLSPLLALLSQVSPGPKLSQPWEGEDRGGSGLAAQTPGVSAFSSSPRGVSW